MGRMGACATTRIMARSCVGREVSCSHSRGNNRSSRREFENVRLAVALDVLAEGGVDGIGLGLEHAEFFGLVNELVVEMGDWWAWGLLCVAIYTRPKRDFNFKMGNKMTDFESLADSITSPEFSDATVRRARTGSTAAPRQSVPATVYRIGSRDRHEGCRVCSPIVSRMSGPRA